MRNKEKDIPLFVVFSNCLPKDENIMKVCLSIEEAEKYITSSIEDSPCLKDVFYMQKSYVTINLNNL